MAGIASRCEEERHRDKDGETKRAMSVPRYDFNRQTCYMFKQPLSIPKGSKIISTAWYDNSRNNR